MNGEGLGVNKMTKDKRSISRTKWTASILAALMFGAFLGSPVPENWTGWFLHNQQSEKTPYIKTASESTVQSELSGPAATAAALGLAINTMVSGPAAENMISYAAAENMVSDPAAENMVSGPGVEVQPDYVSLGANRGGVAGRKEMDVLIRLINAEAYGLSYKAKLAVGQVVMNRWAGPHYGDDLMAIMTAPYQFTPIFDGSAYEKGLEPDSIKAANAVLDGVCVKELTEDTYYFVNPDFTEDKTIENKMEFVCEIEGIHFFRPPSK